MTFTRLMGADAMSIRDDGRTVQGRIVPYNDVVEVVDMNLSTQKLERFREQFLPGSLARLAQGVKKRGNASFITFNLDHDEINFHARIGYATLIEDKEDGAYATFRLYESKDMEKVQSMLRESHTGLSVKFADVREPKMLDGVVSHVQVILEHVAATPIPAYANAGITAMRDDAQADQVESQLTIGTPHLDSVREFLAEMRLMNV